MQYSYSTYIIPAHLVGPLRCSNSSFLPHPRIPHPSSLIIPNQKHPKSSLTIPHHPPPYLTIPHHPPLLLFLTIPRHSHHPISSFTIPYHPSPSPTIPHHSLPSLKHIHHPSQSLTMPHNPTPSITIPYHPSASLVILIISHYP